jgi:hypothetical protein
MKIGSIVFGPVPDKNSASGFSMGQAGLSSKGDQLMACNCIGPQPGQTKCPCALRGEAQLGRQMVEDGVTINGKRYRLIPDPQ